MTTKQLVEALEAAENDAGINGHTDQAHQRILDATKALSSFVDVSNIHEYGLTQKLSNSIRCF